MDVKKQSPVSSGIFEKLAVIFLIVVTSVTLVLCFYTWRNTQLVLDARCDASTQEPFNPPSFKNLPKTARYIVHYVDWTVIASFSADGSEYPLTSEKSVSDGPPTDSTGVPYIYISSFTPLSKNVAKNPKVSFIFTEAQTAYCSKMNYDPEDPRCAKVILSGELIKVPANETAFAKKALFSRHPQMTQWPKWHNFSLMKLVVRDVKVLDFFGGRKDVAVEDYFNAKN